MSIKKIRNLKNENIIKKSQNFAEKNIGNFAITAKKLILEYQRYLIYFGRKI